ncbi:MAG: phosphate signaling complex protein PhoU [Gammaproteobacteria bacterium]
MNTTLKQYGSHISRRFNSELEQLRSEVMRMGGKAEQALAKAVKSVTSGDSEMGLKIARTDRKINKLEVRIDEECSRILATRSPAATDLRLVVAVIKAITDLERIGDESRRIGSLASDMAIGDPSQVYLVELKTLGQHVQNQLRNSLDAFSRMDADDAVRVIEDDIVVDDEYEAIMEKSLSRMMENSDQVKLLVDVTWIARALERIGDHAKNIAEYVIYMVHGKDVRHTKLKKIQKEFGEEAAGDRGD